MSVSTTRFTPEEWDAVFDRFLSSGLTQVAFCKAESITRDIFAYYYRRSDKFAGKRREPKSTAEASTQQVSGIMYQDFVPSNTSQLPVLSQPVNRA